MSTNLSLGEHYEAFIATQLASGRYVDANDVVRDALRLLENRERSASAFDHAIELGLEDVDAGRLHNADAVFDELDAELSALSTASRI